VASTDKIIRDYHGDGDFVWTDAEVGQLVRCIETFEDARFAFIQWAKNPTSPGATAQALMAAQEIAADD
jgi:hypothetical protein